MGYDHAPSLENIIIKLRILGKNAREKNKRPV